MSNINIESPFESSMVWDCLVEAVGHEYPLPESTFLEIIPIID